MCTLLQHPATGPHLDYVTYPLPLPPKNEFLSGRFLFSFFFFFSFFFLLFVSVSVSFSFLFLDCFHLQILALIFTNCFASTGCCGIHGNRWLITSSSHSPLWIYTSHYPNRSFPSSPCRLSPLFHHERWPWSDGVQATVLCRCGARMPRSVLLSEYCCLREALLEGLSRCVFELHTPWAVCAVHCCTRWTSGQEQLADFLLLVLWNQPSFAVRGECGLKKETSQSSSVRQNLKVWPLKWKLSMSTL